MRASVLFTGFLIGLMGSLHGQVPEKYRFKAGEVVMNVLSESERYSYGDFKEGKILFANGKSGTAKLNYNLLYGEMEFISEHGDTLGLANDPIIQNILLGADLFFGDYQNTLVEVIADYPSLKLGARERLVMIREEEGDFVNPENDHFRKLSNDEMSKRNSPSVERITYQEYFTSPLEENLLLVKVVNYYFIDHNNRLHPAKKKIIRRIFPENKRVIKKYIKEHRINFNKEEDLAKLVEFCDQLVYQ